MNTDKHRWKAPEIQAFFAICVHLVVPHFHFTLSTRGAAGALHDKLDVAIGHDAFDRIGQFRRDLHAHELIRLNARDLAVIQLDFKHHAAIAAMAIKQIV